MQTKNEAIASYLKTQTRLHGLGAVILLPTFDGNDTDGWKPVGDGVRATKKDGTSFIRLGAVVLGDGLKTTTRFTNDFMPTEQLNDTLDMLGIVAGGKVPGKLVAIESLTAFRRTNSEQDIKWADKEAGIPCLVDEQPIYRQIVHKMDANAADVLVAHTNREQISAAARAKWAANAKTVSPAILDAGKKQARIDELKAIKKTSRTPEQVAELAELLED